jgi:hypothetical protein
VHRWRYSLAYADSKHWRTIARRRILHCGRWAHDELGYRQTLYAIFKASPMQSTIHTYEIRPRKNKRGVDVISASEMPNDSAHFFP